MKKPIALRDKVLRNLAAQGEAGAAWLFDLPSVVERLEAAWGIRVGAAFPNATEAFVAEAVAADGLGVALKIPIPGLKKGDREARFLQAAQGRGYVRLLRYDPQCGAMLLEKLGTQLARQGLAVDEQIAIVCATLKRAWMPALPGVPLMTGAEKAREMASAISSLWPRFKACSERAVDVALAFAHARAAAFDPATSVVGHGDAHAWNTLHDPETGGYKLVDPDGLFIERAHDLSISLREWCAELLAGDAFALGRRRCALLSRLAGVDEEAIWQWGFLEQLVNGLTYIKVGSEENAGPFLRVAEAWAAPKS